ncbi:hypothetical protein PM082_002539 [Marasmius tenuissimus]|nr:hypothetical protein PM082_002539 [Marasmius tenuissimus]
MVSALVAAAAEGRRENVLEILSENTSIDINGKGNVRSSKRLVQRRDAQEFTNLIADEQGATAIVEAVKNGHVEVVRVLIEKGADPTLAFEYTQDPSMLELLNQNRAYPPQNQEKSYYPPAPPQLVQLAILTTSHTLSQTAPYSTLLLTMTLTTPRTQLVDQETYLHLRLLG